MFESSVETAGGTDLYSSVGRPACRPNKFSTVSEGANDMKLKDKVAFITGFGSGLGQAIAVMFAKEGAAVAGTSKTESKGRETLTMVEELGGRALFRSGDVGNSDQMKKLIDDTVSQFGGLDILVNSAGVRT